MQAKETAIVTETWLPVGKASLLGLSGYYPYLILKKWTKIIASK